MMKIILILSTLMAALSSTNALAADANITFNGTVSASTCTLAAADATKVLTIPNVAPATLLALGNQAYLTYSASGSFSFSACPAGLTKVISNYTYQGALQTGTSNWGVATGTASNVSFYVMQSATALQSANVYVNGTSGPFNQTSIVSNIATVPVTVGISAYNAAGTLTLPTVGTYTGSYVVAFTYS